MKRDIPVSSHNLHTVGFLMRPQKLPTKRYSPKNFFSKDTNNSDIFHHEFEKKYLLALSSALIFRKSLDDKCRQDWPYCESK